MFVNLYNSFFITHTMFINSVVRVSKANWFLKISFFVLFQLCFLLVQSTVWGQATYYVSSAGNDANNGRTIGTPFQSINKVNTLGLQAGDSVLFRRGDTFQGTLTIRASGSANRPVVFDAYGSGQKPVLSGSTPVTSWTNVSGNIWQATCSACGNQLTGLYRNDVGLPLGRWPNADAPNKGTLTIKSHAERYQIVSQQPLTSGNFWQGAEVVMRPTAWIIDRAVVDHQYDNALNLFNYSNYTPADGTGFFFQNHPATLDLNGEWYYNGSTKQVQLYSTSNPNAQTITATVLGRAIDIAYVSYVSLRNLKLTQTLNTNLYATNVSNLTVSGLDITNAGEDGVTITGSGNTILLENSTILDANNNGFSIDAYQNFTMRGTTLRRIGLIAGRGKSGDGAYNGLQSVANLNALIEHNVLDSIGYNGITFGNNTTIRQNVISNYCATKIDGGGIYAWNGNKNPMTNIHILSNIIYTKPYERGTGYYYDYSIGIFLDDCVENVDIKGNTIFGNTQWGAFLHGATAVTFTDNTLFDNYTTQLVVYHNDGKCPIRNDVIQRNIIVSKQASQLVAQYESNGNDLNQYGAIDSNYYARPFDETATILGIINSTQGGRFALTDWRTFSNGLDLHSKGSPITYSQYKNEGSGGTTRFYNTFDTDANGWYILYSNYNNAAATQDNTNKLDGGSLRVSFATPSGQTNSYAQAVNRFGAITKGKTYVLRFDAIASKKVSILVYLRTYGPPYTEYDRRYTISLDTIRTSFELPFTASDSDPDAVMMFQMDGEGPTFWLDNVRLQEDVPIRNNPSDFINLFYNPTLKDSVITLRGAYRDVKNQPYTNSLVLKPFTSIILLKDTVPVLPADLSLTLQTVKRVIAINEIATIRLRVSNQSTNQAALCRWTCRLPATLQFVNASGQAASDNVLTGTVSQLGPLADTLITVLVKPTVSGLFRLGAQLTSATAPDPDSKPNSGLADGEDDAALLELHVVGPSSSVYDAPNPNQRALPAVASSQPAPVPDKADLSLRMVVSSATPRVNEVITYTLFVNNRGGSVADTVWLQNRLPPGVEFVPAPTWDKSGVLLTTKVGPVLVGATLSVSFQVRVVTAGVWLNQVQISKSSKPDPDSTPGNGFDKGEDDQAQIVIRTR